MAFQLGTVDFIARELLPRLERRGRVISLARQRITCPPDLLIDYLGKAGFSTDVPGLSELSTVTSKELFASFGFEHYDDLDFTPEEPCTITHDLNRPIPRKYRGRYDLVFETGTLEHVFDQRAAFANIVRLLRVGGTVFHLSPLTFVNHGFYNYSLTVFHDVYRVNGFEDMAFYLADFPLKWWKNQSLPYRPVDFTTEALPDQPPKGYFLMAGFMARKAADLGKFRVPLQAFYDPALKNDE